MNFLFPSLRNSKKKEVHFEEFVLLPLRELVMYPDTVLPVFISYRGGISAIEEALRRDMRVFTACLRNLNDKETYIVGTVARLIQYIRLPDGTFRVILQGEYRGTMSIRTTNDRFSLVTVSPINSSHEIPNTMECTALIQTVQRSFSQYAELSKRINTETILAVEKTDNLERLANLICNVLNVKIGQKIELLTIADPIERLHTVLETLERENEIFDIQKTIRAKVKSRIDKSQREYVLHEQLKEINRELGKEVSESGDELSDLERSIEERHPSAEALKKVHKEIARLRKLQPLSPEAGVIRGYLECVAELPWAFMSMDSADIEEAEKMLNADHFALYKAKQRILEYIAVLKLISFTSKYESPIKGPILCFVGPPGTGKTSLGSSVARALGRQFVRISLGGVRDEAEIRGHRKTYVGALPGKIIQAIRKASTSNPVILLDEIDKLDSDFHGDPASALLEVLDPEQNINFVDHYLEIPYNLSKVLFIATANSLHGIPYPLLDRMEIIEIPGYSENEKVCIAQQFLVPKQVKENGLSEAVIRFKDETIQSIIRYWTMESGVRDLERSIAQCIRRIARNALKRGFAKEKDIATFKKIVHPHDLNALLGRKQYKRDLFFKETHIGVMNGLAWTETGGTMLPVETILLRGSGKVQVTGNIGDIMDESAHIALSFVRSVYEKYAFTVDDLEKIDIHIHVPEGAIPKDGPSAGITIAASLLSAFCQQPPHANIAMTGELTLTGRILPIGGIKEKLLAAIRNHMEKVLLPAENHDEWLELDKDIRDSLEISFVSYACEAFELLFNETIQRKLSHELRIED
ncbi:MAG: endopeptidase La [Treponema sp.]|jgi:ATP-dependent Lon protease|nr:endopeptidase La [Treponema sp.]